MLSITHIYYGWYILLGSYQLTEFFSTLVILNAPINAPSKNTTIQTKHKIISSEVRIFLVSIGNKYGSKDISPNPFVICITDLLR